MPRPDSGGRTPSTLLPQEPPTPTGKASDVARGNAASPKPKPAAKPKPRTGSPVAATVPAGKSGAVGSVSAADFALVQTVARKYGVDPYILVAIGMHETGWGTMGAGRSGYTLGVGVPDSGGKLSQYAGLAAQLEGAAKILQRNGVSSIEDIAAGKLAPANGKVKYASDPKWTASVVAKYNGIRGTTFAATQSTASGSAGGGSGVGVTGTDQTSAFGADGRVNTGKAVEEFGYIAVLAKSNPDIKRVMESAIRGGWSDAKFQAELERTGWWQKTSEAQRANEIMKSTNPGEYKRRLQQTADQIVILSRNLGIGQDNAAIKTLAEKALQLGWDEQEIQRAVSAGIKVKASGNTGATAVTVDSLRRQARDYLVPISDQTLQTWTSQILKGDVPAESFASYLKEQAASLFPALRGALDSGVTVSQYVEPYRELAAQTLEINPEDVDFMQPKWGQALFQTGKNGERTSMSLADWGQYLRKQPEYAKTRSANEQAASFTNGLLETFGRISA